jgi:hypothetical protein
VKLARRTSGKESLSWPTVTANEDSYRIGGESQQSKCLSAMARRGEMDENWSTPNCTDGKTGSTTTQGRSLVADIQLHGQAAPASSSSLGSRRGLWPTPTNCDHKGATTPEACKQWESRGQNLPEMVVAQWGTPTARDHKSGRGNEDRQYKELTPMVERQQSGKLNSQWVTQLMGLSLGWVSPSCPASVIKNWPRFVSGWCAQTIAPTSCDFSAMELCLPPQSEPSEFSLAS